MGKKLALNNTDAIATFEDVNHHVYAYLDFFLARQKEPNFAVMINGKWGTGKTFLIRRYLNKQVSLASKQYLYVSLYGLATADEINDAVIEALYPMVANKGVKIAGKLAAAIFKKIIIAPTDVKYSDLIDQFGGMVIVFDDLERCKVEPSVVLGFINRYVEHDDCSVIILANEAEIDDANYRRVKEKVVGKTLVVIPSFNEALAVFVDKIVRPDLRDFLMAQSTDIEAIYVTSGTENLRILFQVIIDYERIWDAVGPKFRSNSEAMAALLRLAAALSFELKSGAIEPRDLTDRNLNWVMSFISKGEEKLTPWQEVCRKYPTADLQGSLLSDELLTEILVRGEIKAGNINDCLALSSYFVGDAEPPWRTLWHSYFRTEEACTVAYEAFEKQFFTREFIDPGIILHAFGLKLSLADMGLGHGDRAKAVKECEAYLDDIERAGNLQPLQPGRFYAYDTGYQGLGITERDAPDLQALHSALIERQHKAYTEQMPMAAEALLTDMETSPDLFWRRINHNNIGDQLYADVPIFASCDPKAFVDRLLALNPAHQNSVVMAISSRYDRDALNTRLPDEKPWLQGVCRILEERAKVAPPFTKNRIEASLRHYLAPKAGHTGE